MALAVYGQKGPQFPGRAAGLTGSNTFSSALPLSTSNQSCSAGQKWRKHFNHRLRGALQERMARLRYAQEVPFLQERR